MLRLVFFTKWLEGGNLSSSLQSFSTTATFFFLLSTREKLLQVY